MISLDSYFTKTPFQDPCLLKIDGDNPDATLKVLPGAREVLKNATIVVVEITVESIFKAVTILHELGFEF